ncbi:hypothetical protein J6590_052335 [Homalodisca vitripennis]|nr:hypothetical protein J6590_052335 [Homalodisca vitripennis]
MKRDLPRHVNRASCGGRPPSKNFGPPLKDVPCGIERLGHPSSDEIKLGYQSPAVSTNPTFYCSIQAVVKARGRGEKPTIERAQTS